MQHHFPNYDFECAVENTGDRYILDGQAQQILEAPREIEAADLQKLGFAVSSDRETLPCGAWLVTCFKDAPVISLCRVNSNDEFLLDSCVQDGQMQLRQSRIHGSPQKMRHRFNNQISNIHINAVLIRMLAEKIADEKIHVAAERIVSECAVALDLAGELFSEPALGAGVCRFQPTLERVVESRQSENEGFITRIKHHEYVEQSVVLGVAQFLSRFATSMDEGLSIEFSVLDEAEDDAALSVTIETPTRSDDAIKALYAEWSDRNLDDSCLPNLSRAVNYYCASVCEDVVAISIKY